MIGITPLLYDTSSYHWQHFEDCLLLTSDALKKFQEYYIIKGFYSYNDLSKYKLFDNTHYIFITILRNPIERILSLYEFSHHGWLFPSVRHPLTLKEFLTSDNSIIQSLINNSITWQLGFHLLVNERKRFAKEQNTTLKNINDIVYELAIHHLDSFSYIGFYENLMYDYNELNSRIFSKINKNHDLLDLLFNIGSWLTFFRMRVLKYNARVKHDHEIQTILNQLTFYDMKLYNYAKNEIRHLNFITFDNYFQVSIIIFIVVLYSIGLLFLLSYLRFKVRSNFYTSFL